MNVLKPISNIILYIPSFLTLLTSGMTIPKQDERTSQVVEYIKIAKDHAYACIAVLDMIAVPEHMIRSTLEENLMMGQTELVKYTTLSSYMIFSIEEGLHLFKLRDSMNED